MFTIKLYGSEGYRQVIKEAESFTILRGDDGAEITLHQKDMSQDLRVDIADERENGPADVLAPRRYFKAIIENAAGRTTEIVHLRSPAGLPPRRPAKVSETERTHKWQK